MFRSLRAVVAARFSAPVNLRFDYTDADLTHLMAFDGTRSTAGKPGNASRSIYCCAASRIPHGPRHSISRWLHQAFARVLADAPADPAFAAEALGLPSEGYIAEQMDEIAPDAIHSVRRSLRKRIATTLKSELLSAYRTSTAPQPYSPDPIGWPRALRNLCLGYLMELDDAQVRALCMAQFDAADNMTDSMAALSALANAEGSEREGALQKFYDKWKDEPLVLDKWFAVQASSRLPDTLA